MADDKTGLVGQSNEIYYEQSPTSRLLQLMFVSLVTAMVAITIVLSLYRGLTLGTYGAGHYMLGVSLVGFVAIEICLIVFIRRSDLPKEKGWFLYFVGGCAILEAIFTDVLLFQ